MKLARGIENNIIVVNLKPCIVVGNRESHIQSVEGQVSDLQESISHLQQERTELFSKVHRTA